MKKILFLHLSSWIFLFAFSNANAQEVFLPNNSEELADFLALQGEVPNLSYRFYVSDPAIPDSLLSNSLFSFTQTDSGFVSASGTDFGAIDSASKMLSESNLNFRIQYLLFFRRSRLSQPVGHTWKISLKVEISYSKRKKSSPLQILFP